MAQVKNTFLKSKMNKDLDARLVPNGEYREGRNINVSKSEGADVGALENVLGNENISSALQAELQAIVGVKNSLEIIGLFKHDETSSLYLFITTYSDSSTDQLSNHSGGLGQAYNFICKVTLIENVYSHTILVKGSFLNFSTTHPIVGFNIIEDILFWSDNRNQPRKINLKTAEAYPATSTTPWYYKEDQISVATYAPIEPIRLVKNTGTAWDTASAVYEPTVKDENSEYLPIHLTAPLSSFIGTGSGVDPYGLLFETPSAADKPRWVGRGATTTSLKNYAYKVGTNDYPQIRLINLDQPNQGSMLIYETGNSTSGNAVFAADPNDITVLNNTDLSVLLGWTEGDLIGFQLKNPNYNPNFSGDKEYLKDKFVRFSYRFKYKDNEYSLMAPFTQPVFIPGQWGNFNYLDEEQTATSTELQFFENLLTSAELNIILPDVETATPYNTPLIEDLPRAFNIEAIEILLKFSDNNNVYSIDTVEITSENISSFLAQTTASSATFRNNYPLYSQFIYNYKASRPFKVLPERDIIRVSDATPVRSQSQEVGANRVMYGNYLDKHGAPSSLNYQCSINNKSSDFTAANNPPISTANDTNVKEYYNNTLKQGRTYQVGVVLADRYGRQSSVILAKNDAIGGVATADNSTVYAPYSDDGSLNTLSDWFGNALQVLFNSEIPSNLNVANYPGLYEKSSNPLGWYSYKIVVKQTEQEYYNVYLPGSLSGNVVFTDKDTVLNYNGIYSTSNLSLFGDNINKVPRDTTDIGPTDRMYGSNTSLYFRVYQPVYDAFNKLLNSQLENPKQFDVSTVQPWYDFGPWTSKKGLEVAYPGGTGATPGTIDPIFNADKNPFVATIDHASMRNVRLGFADNLQANGANSKFSTNLIVAETKPVESLLDIFWETSTTGIILELNASIATGAAAAAPKDLSNFNFLFSEQYVYNGIAASPAKYLLDPNITIVTQAGTLTADTNNVIRLTNVTCIKPNGQSANVSTYFDLVKITSVTPHVYNIKLNNPEQYYNLNEPDNIWNGEFIFEFELTTTNSGVAYPPITVTRGNNYLTNNAPEWTSSKNFNNATIPTPIPVSQESFCVSVTGKKDPLKQFAMWKRKSGVSGTVGGGYKFWEIDDDGVSKRNKAFADAGVSGGANSPYFAPKTDFANGSYNDVPAGCKPIIKKIEFATYDKNNTQLYPTSGYEELKINQANETDNTGYPFIEPDSNITTQYPFIFSEDWGSGITSEGWLLQANPECPPWVPVGFNNKILFNTQDRFWPEGSLDGNDYCIYKIHAVVQEEFPLAEASRFETAINDKIFYIRLNR